tara:strand:+ start:875 stop:2944 length:2070 start_codon:yes stop_codon:yes gene_type:complete
MNLMFLKTIYQIKLFSFAIFCMGYFNFFPQEMVCDKVVPSSVKKLYEKGKNYKKYDYKHRVKYYKDALEQEEDCLLCVWELAKMSFRRRYSAGEPMDFPKEYFLKLEGMCPTFHADMYYYLGMIYYMEKNDCEAVNYFNKFLEFPVEDKKKIAVNYNDQKEYVEASLEMSSYFCDFYTNPVPFDPKVLKNVSTADKNEVLPMISPDNEQIYYTSEFDHEVKGDVFIHHEQIFTSSKREDFRKNFKGGNSLEEPFNVGPKYGGATLSLNNKEMYICACMPNGAYMNCDIYSSKLQTVNRVYEDNGRKYDTVVKVWSPLKNIGPNVNGPQSWEAQPSLSSNGKTLYFASARPGGYGKIDIYYSEKLDDGSWGKAKNIGRPINTTESDKSPFIHTDGKTLYFVSESSDLRWGAGDFDIFYARKSKETGKWSAPTNIGYPINSEAPEESLIVSVDGRFGYFSSQRSNGLGGKDIFYFDIPEKAKPDKIILAKGQAESDDSERLSKTKISLRNSDGTKQEQEINIDDDGDFVAVVNVEDVKGDALIEIESEGGAYQSLLVTEEDVSQTVIKDKEIEVNAVEKGQSYTINDIKYETNSSILLSSSKIVLDGFSDWLKSNNEFNIEIQGHTDNVGSDEDNMALSMDRAFSVMEYLISRGVDKSRLSFKGYGESSPKTSNESPEGRSTNRRTDFLIH